MKYVIVLSLLFSLASEAKRRKLKDSNDVCNSPSSKFTSKNLQDLDMMTKFMRLSEAYPWFQYHCNGVICTAKEFENMCYLIKQAKKRKEDPNLIIVGKLN